MSPSACTLSAVLARSAGAGLSCRVALPPPLLPGLSAAALPPAVSVCVLGVTGLSTSESPSAAVASLVPRLPATESPLFCRCSWLGPRLGES